MAHKITHEPDRLGVVITLSGLVQAEEIFELYEKLISDASFPQWRYQIWDFSKAVKLEASVDQLRNLVIQDAIGPHRSQNQRLAIIPRKNPKSGLDQIFHVIQGVWGTHESKTFWDVDTARQWANSGQAPDPHET